jgi:hypothetical protein
MSAITEFNKVNECSHATDKTDSCMDDNTFNKLKIIIENVKIKSKKDGIEKLQTILNCNSESCLFTKLDVKNILSTDEINTQLEINFKPKGPLDKDEWFSDKDIDNVLEQFAKKVSNENFKHIKFQMRDFVETGGVLSTIDFVKEYNDGIRCFGVVINDDVSTGNGTHWTALFGDFRKKPFTIEHFNSTGNGPKNEILIWMEKTKKYLEKTLTTKVNTIVVSNIQHQTDNSSCGPYSVYYIISRLDNIPITVFQKSRIPDISMWEFRKVLFRSK